MLKCAIYFDDNSLREVGDRIVEELFKRKVTTCTNYCPHARIIRFDPVDEHSILRAMAICEDMRVKYNQRCIILRTPEGFSFFRPHTVYSYE